MIARLMQSLFVRGPLLCLVTLLLASCTTAPLAPREKSGAALIPQRVDTFVGNPSAKPLRDGSNECS